jgi:transposase-like protein
MGMNYFQESFFFNNEYVAIRQKFSSSVTVLICNHSSVMFRENPNKKLSLAERGAIVALTNSGLGVREIARQLGISPATVGRWQFRFLETGDILRREGSGRPRVTTPLQDLRLLRVVLNKPITTSKEIAGKV